jgi:hypothetical protein
MAKSKAGKERPGRAARDTPVLGPRGQRAKVRPLPRTTKRGTYDPGVPPVPDGDPRIDEGIPEPNG